MQPPAKRPRRATLPSLFGLCATAIACSPTAAWKHAAAALAHLPPTLADDVYVALGRQRPTMEALWSLCTMWGSSLYSLQLTSCHFSPRSLYVFSLLPALTELSLRGSQVICTRTNCEW